MAVTLKILRAIGSFLFWSYDRGSWQYDLMVVFILAFIFLTPRHIFHDRPSPVEARQVVEVRGDEGTGYRIDAKLLAGPGSVEEQAARIVQESVGRPVAVRHVEPVLDARGRVQAYTVWIQDKK